MKILKQELEILLLKFFPGLDVLYRSRTATKAMTAARSLDKSPDDMVAWISWNNGVVFTEKEAIRRGSYSLSLADQLLTTRFRNTAHRSWYWGSNFSRLIEANFRDFRI